MNNNQASKQFDYGTNRHIVKLDEPLRTENMDLFDIISRFDNMVRLNSPNIYSVIADRNFTYGINLNHFRETFIINPNENRYNIQKVNKINPVKHKILQKNIFGFSCSICYDKYKPDDQIYILKCGHDFCCECIDEWITTSKNNFSSHLKNIYSLYDCPCCRRNIEDNDIFNSGLSLILVKNNFLFELVELKHLNNYKNISKHQLLRLALFEFLLSNPSKNYLDINNFTESECNDKNSHYEKKQKKNRYEKKQKKYSYLEVTSRNKYQNINKNKNKNTKRNYKY